MGFLPQAHLCCIHPSLRASLSLVLCLDGVKLPMFSSFSWNSVHESQGSIVSPSCSLLPSLGSSSRPWLQTCHSPTSHPYLRGSSRLLSRNLLNTDVQQSNHTQCTQHRAPLSSLYLRPLSSCPGRGGGAIPSFQGLRLDPGGFFDLFPSYPTSTQEITRLFLQNMPESDHSSQAPLASSS